MRRFFLALLFATLAGMLGGCDFTPTLDVPLPDFEPALTINGVLAADSTVEVRVTATKDPYLSPYADPVPPGGRYTPSDLFLVPDGAAAEVLVDGAPAGTLRLEPRLCDSDDRYNVVDPVPEVRCGAFVSDVVVEPGRTYTVRASAPGFPSAEATVTVPERVEVSAVAGEPVSTPVPGWVRVDRDVRVTLRDAPSVGDRYALMAVSGPFSRDDTFSLCVDEACTEERDTTVTFRYPYATFGYTSSDPVLLAGARTIPSTGIHFVTFTDEAFDGSERTFEITVRDFTNPDSDRSGGDSGLEAVWLVAVDAETFGAYQVAWFGYPAGEDLNPFQEPIDLPSNVRGGYGLLGAVTINEVLVD